MNESCITPIPILLYHSVSGAPSEWIQRLTVSTGTFRRHMDLVMESGRVPVTVSQLRDGLLGLRGLPGRPVVITFDDGFADTLEAAAPVMAEHAIPATAYITTGFMGGRSPGGDVMLGWSGVRELAGLGHEIGGHSVTHPHLDIVPRVRARHEIVVCRRVLEDALGLPVRSFAYPHGYSSTPIRRMVSEAGYDSACAVRNALSSGTDPAYVMSRLSVEASLQDGDLRRWLGGSTGPRPRPPGRLAVRAWRTCRRVRALPSRLREDPGALTAGADS
jgi:peptidoglycan/xylan/chitin deacetylase (PgdA/CDA1 family)